MDERKLFGYPIREETTGIFYPKKMTLAWFCHDIKSSVDPFEANLKRLGVEGERHVEEWTETFLAWCEIETEHQNSLPQLTYLYLENDRVRRVVDEELKKQNEKDQSSSSQ